MTSTASQYDSPDIVEARQDDGGQLGPVPPLRYEGHGEALDEHLEDLETGDPTAGVVLAVTVNQSVDPGPLRLPGLVLSLLPLPLLVPGQDVSLEEADQSRPDWPFRYSPNLTDTANTLKVVMLQNYICK